MPRTLKRVQLEEQLISGKRWRNTLGLLFTTDTGTPIHSIEPAGTLSQGADRC